MSRDLSHIWMALAHSQTHTLPEVRGEREREREREEEPKISNP